MNSKYVLGAFSAVLIVSLSANVYFYTDTHLQNQLLSLEGELEASNQLIQNLQQENSNLQHDLDQARAPKPHLVTTLGWYLHPERLTVYGEVMNVGTETALNCNLHVTLYRDGTILNETRVSLGTLVFWQRTSVRTDVPYSGDPPTNWTNSRMRPISQAKR